MSTRAKTTILVPTIGRVQFWGDLKACVEAQTRGDFELVILDNAADADASELFRAWAREDARVRVDRVDPRVPMFTNFNRGIRGCATEYFTFFHDDDLYRPRFLEALVGLLESNPGAAFAGSNYDFVDEGGALVEERRWIKETELWPPRRYVAELVGRGRNPVAMSGLVFRRSAFGEEGFDEDLPIHYGDFVLLLRAAEDGGMVASAEALMAIRRHRGQASATTLSRMIPLRTDLLSRYLDDFAGRHPDEATLVRALRRRIALSHRVALLWGWMNADDRGERDACLEGLGGRAPDAVLREALRWADTRGLRPSRLGPTLDRVARAAAASLRF